MVRKMSQAYDSDSERDFSEPRTTAMSSMVIDNSIVFNKARTCMKDSEMQALCLKEVKPFTSEIQLVCAKPLSSVCSVEETKEQKLEKLRKFREMRKQQAKVEYCKDLSNI